MKNNKTHEKYQEKRGDVKKVRVTSVSLEAFQVALMSAKSINASALMRDLLDDYLKNQFPVDYKKMRDNAEL